LLYAKSLALERFRLNIKGIEQIRSALSGVNNETDEQDDNEWLVKWL